LSFKRHFVTFLCLVLAIVFYSLGAAMPGTFLLLLGVLAEAAFWIRIFGRSKDATKK
jgi:hypothetical protein